MSAYKNSPAAALEFLFVYGTLRKPIASDMHPMLAGGCEHYAEGIMQGTLYEVCGYPGAIQSNSTKDKVFGELYQLLDRDRVLARLDEYEECSDWFPKPHEYIRKQLSIELIGGVAVEAWVYLYNRDVSKLQKILSGDYLGG
jgi:gamma-glutamylcyclotransferase (GGCT)/AIG2-like uncharacterized protein YtfP